MDRKGGGPMKWSEFYGRTAEKFFYHPTDWNTTYHTRTILTPQSPQDDNQTGPGVPSRQGLPVHQRPPQFDYIYRANENAKARAEIEAAELKGKMDALVERRVRLEAEQAALWTEIAFRVVSRYDLDKKPLYRFEPLLADGTTEARHQAEKIKNAASFMRLALSIIDEAQKSQAGAFSKIKPAVGKARLRLNDNYLRLGVDVSDRKSTEGRFALLAKRLDDVASNLSDSYIVAQEGDRAKDQLRKDTFRGLLQESLVDYAQIILALDEMATEMKHEWKIKPDPDRPIQFVSLASVEAVRPVVKVFNDVGDAAAPKVVAPKPVDLLELVEIPRDVERGVWSRGRQGIAPIKFEEASGISIRYAVPQEYDLEITFKKLQVVRPPVHDINIGVITQNGDFYQVGIRNQQAFTHIFLYPDKKHQNKTKPIPLNKTQRVIFKVRKDSLEMYLNGQLQIKSELPRKTSNGYKFLIETWRTQVLFESMTLTPV